MTTSGGPEKTVEGRIGFQRLVAEVSLGHVGLVFGIEMSRLARSCRDWHQLLEICALFNTLIADPEGVYDPGGCYNDRLLPGLKATMSEAELHILEARMLEASMAQARRGELGKAVTLVHGGERDRICPAFLPFQAARTDSGRPRSNMRLSALTAIW